MTVSLYSITAEQMRLNDALDAAEGELTPELEDALAINEQNLQDKTVGYCATIMNAKANMKAIDDEIARLQKMKATEKRKSDLLSTRLSDAFRLFGIDKMTADKYRVSFRKSKSVCIDDEDAIPDRFRVVSVAFDKKLIKEAIAAGEEVAGASITENMNLQIR